MEPTTKTSARTWMAVAVGLFILSIVIVVYFRALSAGHWPIGHPWSGLTESLLGMMMFAMALNNVKSPSHRNRVLTLVFGGLASTSATFWLVSAALSHS